MRPSWLRDCLTTSDSKGFEQRLRSALKSLPSGTLPLQSGCGQGGMVDDHDMTFTILGVQRTAEQVRARVGVFFTEVVGGCNCHDDPVKANAYCVLEVTIDRASGLAGFSCVAD